MSNDWVIIGGGPAGIAALGKLLDHGVENIGWIDPRFSVGDLGTKWSFVPSNTKVKLFLDFLNACRSFEFEHRPSKFPIEDLPPQETCLIDFIAEPLRWVTERLKKRVVHYQTTATQLTDFDRDWEVQTLQGPIRAKNVILAIGSEPKVLSENKLERISLETALNPKLLEKEIQSEDTVAVFGSSHSAILVLANLLKLNVKQVIQFYRDPHIYAVYLKDRILYDNTGLKGFAAQWAKEHLDGTLPMNLSRISIFDPKYKESLARCSKTIDAIGFERRKIAIREPYSRLEYNEKNGIIGPGLFGLGIAFPEFYSPVEGPPEYRVGLWKFMEYASRVVPIWLEDSKNRLEIEGKTE